MIGVDHRLRIALSVLTLATQSACATAKYNAEVDSYVGASSAALTSAKRIAVVPNSYESNPLFAAEVQQKIAFLLCSRGYEVVSPDSADFVLLNIFGIGAPQTVSTGGVVVPLRGMIAYVPRSTTHYSRWFAAGLAPADRFRQARTTIEPSEWTWVSTVTSSGESGDLRQVIDILLVAAFTNLRKVLVDA